GVHDGEAEQCTNSVWPVRYSGRHDPAGLAMGDAPGCALLCGAGALPAGALAGWIGEPLAAWSVFSVWRRPTALHRAGVRVAGGGAGGGGDRTEVPVPPSPRIPRSSRTVGDIAPKTRHPDDRKRTMNKRQAKRFSAAKPGA